MDALEDAAFSLRLASQHVRSKAVFTELAGIARIATEASQEFLKSIHTIGLLGPASREEEMQDFLASADRVASLEELRRRAARGAATDLVGRGRFTGRARSRSRWRAISSSRPTT